MVYLRAISALSIIIGCGFIPTSADTVVPNSQHKFTEIISTAKNTILVDKATQFRTQNEDHNVLSGAVFLVVPAEPIDIGDKKVAGFIDSIVGACGYDRATIIDMKFLDAGGKLLGDVQQVITLPMNDSSSPLGQIYAYLCAGVPKGNDHKKETHSYKDGWI
jgi:hypothetical protein